MMNFGIQKKNQINNKIYEYVISSVEYDVECQDLRLESQYEHYKLVSCKCKDIMIE